MSNKRLKLAISPCPNDTFIFGPWINHFIPTDSQLFLDVEYLDIQELNEQALDNIYDLIKISAAHIPNVIKDYAIMTCGGALTDRTGPILVAKKALNIQQIQDYNILLPGRNTTAAFLFCNLFPDAKKVKHVLFSDIETKILNDEADAGVIIHESRFSYKSKGLINILDLGEAWYQKTQCPIPLGVIAIKRNLDLQLKLKIYDQIQKSINWAGGNMQELLPFIQSKSTELDSETIAQHIELYVNQYSKELGDAGKAAILQICYYIQSKEWESTHIFM